VSSLFTRMFGGRAAPNRRRHGRKRINLALQGGGAHGAFTWGVLDQLLADGRLEIDGISGASAGAVNAVMLADGLARGGPDAARQRLAEFWRAASFDGALPDSQRIVMDRLMAFVPAVGSPVQAWVDTWSRFLSPYDLNPLNINPLKDLIERFVNFEAIRNCVDLRLFVSATNVHSGQLRVFSRDEITADAVMASAALPFVFRAVEIDGAPYWDGGYTGNPPIYPLLRGTRSPDVLVVQVNPLFRESTPTSSKQILHRVNEITFNSSLAAELRVIAFISQLLDRGELTSASGEYRPIHMHRIVLDDPKSLEPGSRLNNDYDFFVQLRDSGRHAAKQFLTSHFDDLGVRSTIDNGTKATANAA
jgi:NTE family protein